MIAVKDKLIFIPLVSLLMGFMISDYKVLCNLVGSIATLMLLIYTQGYCGDDYYENKNTRYYVLFLVYYTITSLFNLNIYSWFVYLLFYLILFCPFILYRYIENSRNISLVKVILVIFFVIWTVFCILSVKSCIEVPDLARLMAAYRPSFKNVINGGGYPMGYGAVILSTHLLYLILNNKIKSRLIRWLVFGELILMLFMVMLINSFIILCGLLIGYGIIILNRITKNSKSRLFTYFFFGIVAIVVCVFIGEILLFIADNTTDDFWHKRWMETYNSIINGNDSNHVEERQLMYQISFDSFLQSPIFGVGYKFGNVFSLGDFTYIGNHSTIIDSLAQYGIIGATPLFLFLLYPLKRNIMLGHDSSYLVPFALMSCLNPIFHNFHPILIVYLIIPLTQLLIQDDE